MDDPQIQPSPAISPYGAVGSAESESMTSIIIPAHNRLDLLELTLLNVLQQEGNLEVIVVDDHSDGDVREVISRLDNPESPKIRFFQLDEKRGANAARNLGFSVSHGNYIFFLDSDDLLHPAACNFLISQLETDLTAGAAVGQIVHFREDPNQGELLWNTFAGKTPFERVLNHDPVWGIHGALWRRSALERIGPFDESLPMAQEYELHGRALSHGVKFLLVPTITAYCREHEGVKISTDKALARLKNLIKIFDSFRDILMQRNAYQKADRQRYVSNMLWIANLAALQGDSETCKLALNKATSDGDFGAKVVSSLISLQERKRRHRYHVLVRKIAKTLGFDLDAKETWFKTHRVENEPHLTTLGPCPGPYSL